MTDEKKVEQARSHMSVVAAGLVKTLGPLDAAGILMGAGVGVISEAFGDEKAAQYLRELADELEHDEGGTHGHA